MDSRAITAIVAAAFSILVSLGGAAVIVGQDKERISQLESKVDSMAGIDKLLTAANERIKGLEEDNKTLEGALNSQELALNSAKEMLAGKGAATGKEIEGVIGDIKELKEDTVPKERVEAYIARVDEIDKKLVPRTEITNLADSINELKKSLANYATKTELANTDANILDVKTRKIKFEDATFAWRAEVDQTITSLKEKTVSNDGAQ